jgi:hypothetical protein
MAPAAAVVIAYLFLTVGLEEFAPSWVFEFSRQEPIIFGLAVTVTCVIAAAVMMLVGRLKP